MTTLPNQARALVDELAALMNDYPTEDPDVTPVALPRITVAGEDVGTVALLPGQVAWLRALVAAEAATIQAATDPGTPDQCGHCHGTGRAGHENPDPGRER